MDTKQTNLQALAFIGDAVFSLFIREQLLKLGISNSNTLQKKSIEYVSAKGQVNILNGLINAKVLNEEELDIVRKGRNNNNSNHPKNTDIITYKLSTGFEALLGYLYLNNPKRLAELLKKVEVRK